MRLYNKINMNMEKRIIYVLCFVTSLLYTSCNSCEGTDDSFRSGSSKSKSKELIDKNINDLGLERWNKQKYIEIRDNQIATFKGTQNAKTALRGKLDNVYGKVLVKEGNLLMSNKCGSNHKTLSLVIAELKNFPNAEDREDLEKRYKEHQEMLSFINSMYAKQKVNSFNDQYNKSFETDIKNKAANYLKREISCVTIKNGLNNTAAAFNARRKDFADKVVELYCQQTSYNRRDYNLTITKLENLKLKDNSWELKMQDFKQKYSNE